MYPNLNVEKRVAVLHVNALRRGIHNQEQNINANCNCAIIRFADYSIFGKKGFCRSHITC